MSSWDSAPEEGAAMVQQDFDGVVRKITIDEAIDRLAKGRFQRRLLYASGVCNGVNAMAVMALSFIRNAIIIEFNISIDQSSWFESSVFFGILFGTLAFGPLGDRVGRKPMFLLSSTITAVCGLASAYAPTFEALVLLRFGVGIGVGGTVIPFDTLAELTPSRFRGAFLLYLGYFWTVGTSATPLLAWYAMQEKESWRLFLLLCSIPCWFSMIFGYLWVPESPRWLLTQGRDEEALTILQNAAKSNNQNADKVYPPGTILTDSSEDEQMDSIASLFMPQWRSMVICMLLVWAFLDFIYWGTIQVVTLVFAEFEGNLKLFEDGEQYAYDYGAIFGSSLAEIIGQTAVLALIDRVGRVPTQAVAYAAGALSVFCLCLVAYMEDTGSETERYILVLLAFCSRMFIMAATSVTWVHTAEMLPTQIRNTAHAVADALAGSGGALSPFIVSPDHSMLTIGIVMGTITITTASLTWMLPETRGVALGTAISRASSPKASPSPSTLDGSDDQNAADTLTMEEAIPRDKDDDVVEAADDSEKGDKVVLEENVIEAVDDDVVETTNDKNIETEASKDVSEAADENVGSTDAQNTDAADDNAAEQVIQTTGTQGSWEELDAGEEERIAAS